MGRVSRSTGTGAWCSSRGVMLHQQAVGSSDATPAAVPMHAVLSVFCVSLLLVAA